MSPAPVHLHVQPHSGVPIYRQVVEQIRAMIAGGQLAEGDMLPSVRQVADDLAVNPMTISKAYALLENDGWVERLRGQGMRVRPRDADTRPRQRMLEPLLRDLVLRGRQLGLSDDRILQAMRKALKENKP